MPLVACRRDAEPAHEDGARERTPLAGDYDVLVCGASFAGLAVARELAGARTGGGRRACWCWTATRSASARPPPAPRRRTGSRRSGSSARSARRSTAGACTRRTRRARFPLPWTFSTFDYPALCALLDDQNDAEFETATVDGRAAARGRRARRRCSTDRGEVSRAARRRRARLAPGARRRRLPAAGRAALARARGASRAGRAASSRSGSTARSCRRATAGASRPATRCGSASARSTRASTSRSRRSTWPSGCERDAVRYQGNWIPHRLRAADRRDVFFAGDSAGHCLPLTAEGIRTAFYFGIALRPRAAPGARGTRHARDRAAPLRRVLGAGTSGSSVDAARAAARAARAAARCWRSRSRAMATHALHALVVRPLPEDRPPELRAAAAPAPAPARARAGRLSRSARALRFAAGGQPCVAAPNANTTKEDRHEHHGQDHRPREEGGRRPDRRRSLRRQGAREERKGEAKDQLDNAQDKAADKADEVADLERKT